MGTKFNSLLYEANRFHVAVHLSSNRSQRTSKCGTKISDTLGYRLVCHFFVLTTFWRHLWSITEQMHGNMETFNDWPLGKQWVLFPLDLNVPRGDQNSLIPLGPVIKSLLISKLMEGDRYSLLLSQSQMSRSLAARRKRDSSSIFVQRKTEGTAPSFNKCIQFKISARNNRNYSLPR